MTNLHLANEEQVWERLNLWDRLRPNMGLSDADRLLLGPLADIKTYSDHPAEIICHLSECVQRMSHAVGQEAHMRRRLLCCHDRSQGDRQAVA